MLKIVSKQEYIDFCKKHPPMQEWEKRRFKLYYDMFDNPLVDANYVYFLDNQSNYLGECVLCFKDKREETEFEYEKLLRNRQNCCLLKNLWIEEGHRGKGLFSVMLKQIEQLVLKHNCNKIVLSVDKQNVHAREVYEHLGFKPTNETSQDKQLEFYEKPLNLPKKQNIQAQKQNLEL